MRSNVVVIAALLLIGLIGIGIPLSAFGTDGTDMARTSVRSVVHVGGTGPGNNTSISEGISNSTSGGSLIIHPGTYNENVIIPTGKTLDVVGTNVIISGTNTSMSTLTIDSPWSNVTGLTLMNSGTAAGNAGIYINSDNNRIIDCVVTTNPADGIYVNNSEGNLISGCTVDESDMTGIVLAGSNMNTITDCTITGSMNDGVYINMSNGNSIIDTSINANGWTGISIDTITNTQITDCNISNNGRDGLYASSSTGLTLTSVNFTSNALSGISLDSVGSSGLNNVRSFSNSVDGAYFLDSSSVTVSSSAFWTNDMSGISIRGGNGHVIKNTTSYTNGIDGFYIEMSHHVRFEHTLVHSNDYSGITLADATYCSIAMSNLTSDYDASINLKGSDFNYITANMLGNNDKYAVQLDIDSNNNHIFNNHINNNKPGGRQGYDNGTDNMWDDGSRGNYWSDWTSPDVDGDGIVDIPYPLWGVGNGSDRYPLTAPKGVPNIFTEPVTTTPERELYLVEYGATDSDTPPTGLVWDFDSNASWLDFNEDLELFGTPTTEDMGVYWVMISVSDGTFTDTTEFDLEVINVNDPPVITTTNVKTCYEDITYYVDYEADDIDPTKDTLYWFMTEGPWWLSMDMSSGVLTGVPGNWEVGTHDITIDVNDGRGGEDSTSFTLTVEDVNDVPYLNSTLPDVTFDEDTTFYVGYLPFFFFDIDDELTFRIEGNDKISVDISDGHVNLIPERDWSGSEELTIYGNDSKAEVTDTVLVTVREVNDAPTGLSIDITNTTFMTEEEQTCRGTAEDVDIVYGDSLTYTWTSNVTGTIGTGQNITFLLQPGAHTITLNVSDERGGWQKTSIYVNVEEKEEIGSDLQMSNSCWFLLIIIIAVVAIVALISFFVIKKKMDEKEDEEPEPEPVDEEEEYVEPEPIEEPVVVEEQMDLPIDEQFQPVQPEEEIEDAISYGDIVDSSEDEAQPTEDVSMESVVSELFNMDEIHQEGGEVLEAACYNCEGMIPIESNDRPLLLTCPHCGTESQLD